MTRLVAAVAVLLVFVAGCNENAAYARVAEAHRLAVLLGTEFARATNASDRAVMADTDDASATFAREALAATEAVQSGMTQMAPVLANLGYTDETRLLDDFGRRFAEYRSLDSSILALAAEGTNVKAQRLSFGAAQQAVDELRDALDRLVPANPAANGWRVKALAATALASAREIQVLHAPHIAEVQEAEMTRLEAQMTSAEATARQALLDLQRLVSAGSRADVATATAALDRLSSLNSQIRTLSRRNTNVRALALSLGQKRVLAAGCDSALRALQRAVSKRGLPTR